MKYYVYLLCDPRRGNEPFYIGKGSGDRVRVHFRKRKIASENPWKYAKIEKIRAAGLEPIIEYVAQGLPEDLAYDLEAELIKYHGRAKIDGGGILTNMCIDNRPPAWPVGKRMPEETKKKIADAQRGEKNHRYGDHWSEEAKQQRSLRAKAAGERPPVRNGPMSDEQKMAIGAGNRGKKRTPEQSAHLSEIRRGKKREKRGPMSVETREKIRQAHYRRYIAKMAVLEG